MASTLYVSCVWFAGYKIALRVLWQCRCDSSLQTPALLLREGFINDGYQSMVNYTRNSTSIERIEKLQTFIRSNLQASLAS